MASMVVSDLRIIGQSGTTIALGLLFDTLIVRSFMTPSIAALLGRWFWWPQRVRPRPASALLLRSGPSAGKVPAAQGGPRRRRRQAVADYRAKHGISAEISKIDQCGVLWRK
jgi:hypothetical protein